MDAGFGRFVGSVTTEWLPDGRRMRLLDDFAFIDVNDITWDAPREWVVDGASIPKPLWTIVGSPFTGHYRNASVVHDVACDRRKSDWQAVHRMFYEAMRCGGVGEPRAKLMFAAVYRFGPRWYPTGRILFPERVGAAEEPREPVAVPTYSWSDDEFTALERLITKDNPSIESLEHMLI